MSDDLVARLRHAWDERERQLDEDERVAQAATTGPWRYDPTQHHREPGTVRFSEGVFTGPAGRDATCVAITGETDDPQSMADAAHIARHDPARVLAEVERGRRDIAAKRRILAEHRPVLADDVPGLAMCFADNEVMPCDHVRWLAAAEGLA
jgi:hypothetical protein